MASGRALRIVSLAPSVSSILAALGAADCLIAVTRWCKDVVAPETIHGLPVLDDAWSADPEKVAELEPDLVIGGVPYRAKVVDAMLARGLRFLATSPRSLEDIYGDIRALARIVRREAAGERLIGAMRGRLGAIRQQAAASAHRPRVYSEVWPNPLRSSEPWVEEMVEAAGGEFVPRPAGRQVSSEEVIASDPEIIVLAWAATGDRAHPEKVRERPGWEKIRAVRDERIHVIRDELVNTPAPILLEGLNALRAIIQPAILEPERPVT